MNTNAWITLENTLALTWWDYYQWAINPDPNRGPAPPIDPFGEKAVRRLVDVDHAFRCFKKATIQSREWRLLSVWGVTHGQLQAGYNAYGDAEAGGDYAVVGFWAWNARGDAYCPIDLRYNWRPAQVIKYMPDECADPDCATTVPADEVWDVVLLAGQPPRELPAEDRVHRR